ncbi:MAG TPA: hypothetical protein PKJ45_13815 [Rubrivivax sp.]|nr:hypothetical protein [Thauera sp.]HNU12417.1 hypothetical protein [Rubrivivax sp.]
MIPYTISPALQESSDLIQRFREQFGVEPGVVHPKTLAPLGRSQSIKLIKQALETGEIPEELTGPAVLDEVHDEQATPSATPAEAGRTEASEKQSKTLPEPIKAAASNLLASFNEDLDDLDRALESRRASKP